MTRFKKVYRDLWLKKSRTLLVVLATALGILGVGSVLNTNYILEREMNSNYMDTNPASFILWMDKTDDKLIQILEDMPEIKDMELRKTVTGRILAGENEWGTIMLYAIENFDNLKIDTFSYEEGKRAPLDGEILIERDAFRVAKTSIGETVQIKIPGGTPQSLKVTGSVHAPGLPAAHAEHFSYGFISQKTLEQLGDKSGLNEFRVVVSGDIYDKEYIEDVSIKAEEILKTNGYVVRSIEIPIPGKHPHGDEISGFMFILQAFGVLSLLMSSVLVVNMISNLLAGQIRQIGIMKSTGAGVGQIVSIYYSMVLVLGITALIIGVPTAVLLGRGCASFSAMELNFNIKDNSIPLVSFIIQGLTGILIPLLAATIPVVKACRVPVRVAISDYGISQDKVSAKDEIKEMGLTGPMMLSIRNTFRKKGRLLLTFGTLVLGGSLFILSLNIFTSLNNTVEQSFKALQYDVEVRLSRQYSIEELAAASDGIAGINKIEYMNFSAAVLKRKDSVASKKYLLKAVPVDATLIKLPILEGRWYNSEDKNGIVINHNLANKEPNVKVGDSVDINVEGRDLKFTVIGIAKEVASRPTIYMNRNVYLDVIENNGSANYILFKTDKKDYDTQRKLLTSFERNAEKNGLDILDAWMTYQHRKSFLDHLTMVLSFLIFMAVLTVIVGGMGLASTMGISVLERMREIGVMRSIGASNSDIIKIVLVEGLLIGSISWIIVCILSIPLAPTIGNQIGILALHIKLDTAFSLISYIVWLVLIIAITAVSSVVPAVKASNVPVRDIIAYE